MTDDPFVVPDGWEEVPAPALTDTEAAAMIDRVTETPGMGMEVYYSNSRGELYPFYQLATLCFAVEHHCQPVSHHYQTHFIRPTATVANEDGDKTT